MKMGIPLTQVALQIVVCLWFSLRLGEQSHGIDGHGLLREAKEELAPTLGSPAIEAEGELIQIVVEEIGSFAGEPAARP